MTNRRCPVCFSNGRDTGSDAGHLFLMKGGDKWCCNRVDNHPNRRMVFYHNNPDTNEPLFEDSEETETLEQEPAQTKITKEDNGEVILGVVGEYRGVPASVWEEYGVTFEMEHSNIVKQYYPITSNGEPLCRKIRVVDTKEFYWEKFPKGKKRDLFGSSTLGGKIPKKLLLTEGEVDAVSARYMLSKYHVKVLSPLDGASIKNICDNVQLLEKVEELVLCFDNDKPGQEFTEKVVSMFPSARVMKISLKDANEMLVAGRQAEFVQAFYESKKYSPPSLVEISSIIDSLKESVPVGMDYPWQSLTDITYGITNHQIISIGSGPGAGKTTLVRGIQDQLMFQLDKPIGIFSLEESKEYTLRQLVGYQMNQRIHLPGYKYDIDEAVHHAKRLDGRAFIYDKRYFNGEWQNIEKAIRFMVASGICHFFIDPITALVVHLSTSDQNTALGKIMSDLSTLMQELPIYIMSVNHLNNPTSGPSHDEGGMVLPSQFTGSKSQWRFSTDMWGLERNILSEDEEAKNTVKVRILKHRMDGSLTGSVCKLGFSKDTGRLFDKSEEFTAVETKPKEVIIVRKQEETKVVKEEVKRSALDEILG